MAGLAALAASQLDQDPFRDALFIFCEHWGHLLKILYLDVQGQVLYAKRLERGQFVSPTGQQGAISLTPAQLAMHSGGSTGAHQPEWLVGSLV